VARYAREIGVTPGQLGRLCRELLGMSPLDAINARVLAEAQRSLVYSTLSIKQVAAELGFDDEAYFGRFFKKQAGAQPTAYRFAGRRMLVGTAARSVEGALPDRPAATGPRRRASSRPGARPGVARTNSVSVFSG
jgi:AraC family transcriptional activator of pobA